MNIEPDNKRKFPRIHFDRHVKLEFIHDAYYPKVKNVSLTGMFIAGDFHKNDSKYCFVKLYQAENSADFNVSLQASARVVRKNEKGIAIQYIAMPFDSYNFLQSTLIIDSENPLTIREALPESCPFTITDDLSGSFVRETKMHSNN